MAINKALNDKVHELLQQQIADGEQLGVQACAYKDGEMIVDTWAGLMGPEDPRPVQADTLFSSFSTTKGVAAAALHILADKGLIEYEAPVAKYWPEFAVNGKGKITVAQAMSHQGGLHAMPENATVEDMTDWDRGINHIANATPAWEPGTATGYHGITYAWVVGGIVQGASGRHIKDVIREEIAEPLGIADQMYVGIPDGVEARLTTLITPGPAENPPAVEMPELPPDHDMYKAMPQHLGTNIFNTMDVRKACIPSANGHFSARALAKMYAALANGGEIGGVRLVSPERIAKMSAIQTEEPDRVIMMPIPKSIGFMNGGHSELARSVTGPRKSAFGHSGAGGSTAYADPEVRLSTAVTINQMQMSLQAEGPTYAICELIRQELGVA